MRLGRKISSTCILNWPWAKNIMPCDHLMQVLCTRETDCKLAGETHPSLSVSFSLPELTPCLGQCFSHQYLDLLKVKEVTTWPLSKLLISTLTIVYVMQLPVSVENKYNRLCRINGANCVKASVNYVKTPVRS